MRARQIQIAVVVSALMCPIIGAAKVRNYPLSDVDDISAPSRSVFVNFQQQSGRDAISPVRCASMQRPDCAYIAQRLASPRRGFDFLKSVKFYLEWRQQSAIVPFLSWRNQPSQVSALSHALLIINTALTQDVSADIQTQTMAAECPHGTVRIGEDARHKWDSRQSALSGRSASPAPVLVVNPQKGSTKMRQLLMSLIEQARDGGLSYREFIFFTKHQYVTQVLQANKFNQSKAARELGMHRNTLSRTIAELGIDVNALQDAAKKPVQRITAKTEPVSMEHLG